MAWQLVIKYQLSVVHVQTGVLRALVIGCMTEMGTGASVGPGPRSTHPHTQTLVLLAVLLLCCSGGHHIG